MNSRETHTQLTSSSRPREGLGKCRVDRLGRVSAFLDSRSDDNPAGNRQQRFDRLDTGTTAGKQASIRNGLTDTA